MSVPKGKQGLSGMEFYHNARKLRKEMKEFLRRDFGVHSRKNAHNIDPSLPDDWYDGWCEKCLRETINYDTFFEYCEANKGENYLDTFVMCYLLNCDQDEVPKYPSWEFHQLMVETYKRRVANAKLLGEKFGFLAYCIQFVMDDDGYSGRENYAEWLNNRKVVK